MAVLMTPPFLQFFDDNGNPLSGGKIYTYNAGTTTKKATYTTSDATVQNTNPIILDAAGRAVIFIAGSYRFDIYDATDSLIRSVDDITSFATLESSSTSLFNKFSGDGTTRIFTASASLGSDSNGVQIFVDSGSPEYVTNGNFASDSGWTKGAGWTIGGGVATATGAISTAISQSAAITVVAGRYYRLSYDVTRSAGTITPSLGGSAGNARSATGTYTELIYSGSTQEIAFTGAGFTGTIDNVSLQAVSTNGFQIQDPSTYVINGTTIEFATAPKSGTNNIYVFALNQLVGAAVAAADQAIAAAAAADAAAATVANQKIVWMGDWAAGTYNVNEAVLYDGSAWIVTATTTTDTPSLVSADWDMLAEKGADGTGGVTAPLSANVGGYLRASGVGTYSWFNGNTNVASAATVDLTTSTTNVVTISGTTTITSLGVPANSGDVRFVRFTGAMILTHNGTNISLPTNANITTANGDTAIFVSSGSNGWRCYCYNRVNGTPLVFPSINGLTTLSSALTADDRVGIYNQTDAANRKITMRTFHSYSGAPHIVARHLLASGTAGGATSATTWHTRPLSSVRNAVTGASIASNQITLPSGTYHVRAWHVVNRVDFHQIGLYSVSNTSYFATGTGSYASQANSQGGFAELSHVMTLAASTVFELRSYASAAQAVNGLGNPASSGQSEVYAAIEITKLDD